MTRHTKASRRHAFRASAETPFDFFVMMDRSGFAKAIRARCREQQGDDVGVLVDEGIDLAITCGACPVQVEGTVDGMHLYFRARHGVWRICIATTKDGAVMGEGVVYADSGDDDDEGWMMHAETWRIVRESIAAWRSQRPGESTAPDGRSE